MLDKEKMILENLEKVLPKIPEAKKEYFLGVADGLAMAYERKQMNDPEQKDG